MARFVPRSLQVVPSRQFRQDRRVRNRVSLNNSRSIRRRSSARMEAAPFCGLKPAIITTTPSPPVLLSRARSIFSFSSFPAALSRQSWLCVTIVRSLDRPIVRSQVADRLQTIRAYTPGIPGIETEGSEGAQGISSSFWSSFIPAFLLDNEHPGYRKERAAYGRQKLLPVRLTSLAISRLSPLNLPTTGDLIRSKTISIIRLDLVRRWKNEHFFRY